MRNVKKKNKAFLSVILLLSVFITPAFSQINWAQALQTSIYFYDANMCGLDAGQASRLQWRGPCHVWDALAEHPFDAGKTIDISGGFHDCGDHVKFGQPQMYAIHTLGWGYYEFKEAFQQTGQQQHILDVLKWGCDYFLRCTELDVNGDVRFFVYLVGKGGSDHVVWIPPELQTKDMDARPYVYASPSTPAAEMAAGASAALTLMYLNYKDIDSAYADKCFTYSKALYKLARDYGGLGTGDGFYNSRDNEDDLSWAATWLYVATGDIEYIHHIDASDAGGIYTGYMKGILASTANSWQNIHVYCWDAVWAGVFTKLACLFPEREDFNYYGRWNLEYWSGGTVSHDDPSDTNYLDPTPAGYAINNTWGSARYNTAAQLCALIYNKYRPDRKGTQLAEWARGQMEYILGANPMGYSYMVGYPSPEESAKHPHHRAAHGSFTNSMQDPTEHKHVLWGALVGGPDTSDQHVDETRDFVYNEVGVDYNAAVVGALAAHYLLWGQNNQPLADFPPAEPPAEELYAEAKIEQDNSQRTQVTIRIHNESCQPPRYLENISCQYYFNISELIAAGQSISDVSHTLMYDELGITGKATVQVAGPLEYDLDRGIYYMEYLWEYGQWIGDMDILIALVAKQDAGYNENWDPSNDWSHQGLNETGLVKTQNIPMYIGGVHIYGAGPDDTEPTPSPTPVDTPVPTDSGGLLGDIDGSGSVNIVDALLAAQYYVGLDPQNFDTTKADVNCDGSINIIDALLIAQYYVGLIPPFQC